jgi:hypothetical protein
LEQALVPLHFLAIDAVEGTIDVQATLLNFLGQQAIAHAATIFATLLAAFTFAEAVGKRESSRGTFYGEGSLGTFYVFMLNVLFGVAIYAGFRLIYYGILWGLVLNNTPLETTLTCYWQSVSALFTGGSPADPCLRFQNATLSYYALSFVRLQLYLTIPNLLLSWGLGFLIAVGVAEYCGGSKGGWFAAFRSTQLWLRKLGFWALAAYIAYIVTLEVIRQFFSTLNLGAVDRIFILVIGGIVFETLAWLLYLLYLRIRKKLSCGEFIGYGPS